MILIWPAYAHWKYAANIFTGLSKRFSNFELKIKNWQNDTLEETLFPFTKKWQPRIKNCKSVLFLLIQGNILERLMC